jgi:hypothetical protein
MYLCANECMNACVCVCLCMCEIVTHLERFFFIDAWKEALRVAGFHDGKQGTATPDGGRYGRAVGSVSGLP